MHHTRTIALLALLWPAACDDSKPAAKTTELAKAAEPVKPAADEAKQPDAARQALLAERRERKRLHDELAAAYAAGTIGDRLVTGNQLLIDPKVTGVETVSYSLFKGALADPPGDPLALAATKGSDGAAPLRLLLGGVDASRPAIFDDVEAGPYTVCVLVGPATDPEKERVIQEVAAEFEARPDFKLSPETLAAMEVQVKARLGRDPKESRDPQGLRCVGVTVGADAASRIVALPAAGAATPATPATTPDDKPVTTGVGGWRVKSAKWGDGAAAGLPKNLVVPVTACLRTVKKPEAEVVITIAGGVVKKVDVRKASLKCVEELPGIKAPSLDRDGDLTAIFAHD